MAEKERPSGKALANAIRAQRQSGDVTDRSVLSDTLVKSSLWKKNTLQTLEAPSGDNDETADSEESLQSTTLRRPDEKIERLQRMIAKLNAENARLAALRQDELDTHENELTEFQQAYDQFQQQSDLLLNELEQENERLRTECKLTNSRSLL